MSKLNIGVDYSKLANVKNESAKRIAHIPSKAMHKESNKIPMEMHGVLEFELAQEAEAMKQYRANKHKIEMSQKALRAEFPNMGHEELKVKAPKKHFDIDWTKAPNGDFAKPCFLVRTHSFYAGNTPEEQDRMLAYVLDEANNLGLLPKEYMIKKFAEEMKFFKFIMKNACPQMLEVEDTDDGKQYAVDIETKKAFVEAYMQRHGGLRMILITDEYHDQFQLAGRLTDDSIVAVIHKEYGFPLSKDRVVGKHGPGAHVERTLKPNGEPIKKKFVKRVSVMHPQAYIDKYCDTSDPYGACNNFAPHKLKYRVTPDTMYHTKLEHELTSLDKGYLEAQLENKDTSKFSITRGDSGIIWGVDSETAQMDIEYIQAVNEFLAQHPEEADLFDDIDTKVCPNCGRKLKMSLTEHTQFCPHCGKPFVNDLVVASFGSIALMERIGLDEEGNVIYAESYGDEIDGEIVWHDNPDWEDGDEVLYDDDEDDITETAE